MVKIVKNPGNGRLNNLNDPVLNVLIKYCGKLQSILAMISRFLAAVRYQSLLTANRSVKLCVVVPIQLLMAVKIKFTLEQATKSQKGSRCIALLFL